MESTSKGQAVGVYSVGVRGERPGTGAGEIVNVWYSSVTLEGLPEACLRSRCHLWLVITRFRV